MPGSWDLTALVNAADTKAGLAERHLWLVRLTGWLRHAPTTALLRTNASLVRSESLSPLALGIGGSSSG
jgi:hypothetical protein